jgi:hypothetical protein
MDVLTSAFAIWEPIFDPFFPEAGTDSSAMALIARRLVSVLPDPTAPLTVSRVETGYSPHNHDLILSGSPHVIVRAERQSKEMGTKLFLDDISSISQSRIRD